MLGVALRRTGRFSSLIVTTALLTTAGGCVDDRMGPVAHNRVVNPPAEVEQAMRPLSIDPAADPAPETATAQADNVVSTRACWSSPRTARTPLLPPSPPPSIISGRRTTC